MKRNYIIAIQLLVLVFVLDYTIIKVKHIRLSSMDYYDIILILIAPLAFILLAALAAFFISSLLKGQYTKRSFLDVFSWTVMPSLLLALFIIYQQVQSWHRHEYRSSNKMHNSFYYTLYNDDRDENIKMAIDNLYHSQDEGDDIRIKRMRVIERDTVLDNQFQKYYDIQLIYCLGESCNNKNSYASRQLVVSSNVINIFMEESISGKTGSELNQEIEQRLGLKTTNLTKEEVLDISISIVHDQVKLAE